MHTVTVVRLSSMVGLEFSYYFFKIRKAIEVEKQKFRHTLRETGERRRRAVWGGRKYFDDNLKRVTDKSEDVSRRCTLTVESDPKETSGTYRLGNVY